MGRTLISNWDRSGPRCRAVPGRIRTLIRWNTETSFDEVPFADKLRYVFQSVSIAFAHPELSFNNRNLSNDDIAIMYEAFMLNPRPDRTYFLWEKGCNWYRQETSQGGEPNLSHMIDLVVTGDRYDKEGQEAPYLVAYEMLSSGAKEIVLAEIEALRGRRVMASSHTDYARLWIDYPDRAAQFFDRMCDKISDRVRELDDWPEYKTIEWEQDEENQ